jgi:hypothetical protein
MFIGARVGLALAMATGFGIFAPVGVARIWTFATTRAVGGADNFRGFGNEATVETGPDGWACSIAA